MVDVMNGNFDKAMRDLNRYLQTNGVISEVKSRAHRIKPCEERSMQKAKRLANIRKYSKTGNKKFPRSLQIFGSSAV